MADGNFGFSQLGLASILGQNKLTVPPNQRDYSWTTRQVQTLFQDFARSIAESDSTYFPGTIVTTPRLDGGLEVVDGQQRLATTAILLAEIRNYLQDKDEMIAQAVEEELLTVIDRTTRARREKWATRSALLLDPTCTSASQSRYPSPRFVLIRLPPRNGGLPTMASNPCGRPCACSRAGS